MGFSPHEDAAMSLKILGDAQPVNCAAAIPLGKDGKPLFVNGPYDDVERIIHTLNRNVGRVQVFIFLEDETEGWFEDDF